MLKITLEFNGKVLETFTVDKPEILIGRSSANDIVIENLAVSGRHARVVRENDQYVLEDLDSTNGTYCGSRKIKQMAIGSQEETFRIGKHTLKIQKVEEKAATPGFERTIKVDPK